MPPVAVFPSLSFSPTHMPKPRACSISGAAADAVVLWLYCGLDLERDGYFFTAAICCVEIMGVSCDIQSQMSRAPKLRDIWIEVFFFFFFSFLIEANNESWGLPSQEAEAPKEQCSQCQRSTRTARGCLCIRTAPVGRCVIRIQVGEDAVPVWACVRIPLSTESADAASGELNVLAPA